MLFEISAEGNVRDEEAFCHRCGELIAGSYSLREVIGVGGMGVVYAAVQRSLDRIVALKLPRPELLDDPRVRARLRTEALVSSRIEHRNAVRVVDFGDHMNAPYLVMEHVAGPRLSRVLDEHKRLPVELALGMTRQVVSALEEAHRNGIVHADVKCDNVLVEVRRDGSMTPRLIDWGIAHFVGQHEGDYGLEVTGTPEYLAPEVLQGAPPGYASDVYAVGVMLYELLSGTTPFKLGGSPLEIPHDVDALLMQALENDPELRFHDAAALGSALDAVTSSTLEAPIAHEPTVDDCRVALARAWTCTDAGPIIVAYLELARRLVDEHKLVDAVHELERGVELVAALPSGGPLWRLLLALAALYDGVGNRRRALDAAVLAQAWALRDDSEVGRERARELSARLARSRRLTRR